MAKLESMQTVVDSTLAAPQFFSWLASGFAGFASAADDDWIVRPAELPGDATDARDWRAVGGLVRTGNGY